MRTIKFRAWHKSEKLMCQLKTLTDEGGFLLGVKKGKDEYFDNGKSISLAPTDGSFCFNNDFELMQFTGLKDKNGKDIYDGDIIIFEDDVIDIIVWNNEWQYHTKKNFDNSQSGLDECEAEVIGNIYETPELLE